MDKNQRQRNLAILFVLTTFVSILFGIGFVRVNGKNMPEPKKSTFLGIKELFSNSSKKQMIEK